MYKELSNEHAVSRDRMTCDLLPKNLYQWKIPLFSFFFRASLQEHQTEQP